MSDKREDRASVSSAELEGRMYLYEKPELLTKEDHGKLGLSKVDNPYEFVRNVRMVPVVVTEIVSAQKYYPVVFSELENPVPIAVVGVLEDKNLFVDESGRWDRLTYIPSYLRRHPFAFARHSEDKFSVVVDRAAGVVSENPEFPFFEGDELSENTQAMVDFCSQYEAERQRTNAFCARLKELDLLIPQQSAYRPGGGEEEKPMANYVGVDVNRLNDLDKDILQELHQSGSLASIFAHLFSLENWNRLLDRRAWRKQSAEA